MSERLTRLTTNEQKPAKPDSEGGNNDAAPRTISHDPGNSADRDYGQPNQCHSNFVHGQNSSTTKALPHVVSALIAKRAEIVGQTEHLQGQVKCLTIDLDLVEETLRLFAADIDVQAIAPRPVPAAPEICAHCSRFVGRK